MTNNPTIDGVSRELLERVCGIRQKSYDIEDAMQAGAELRSFLAQNASDEPVEIVQSDNADQAFMLMDFALSFALCNTDHGGTRRDVKKAQAHLGALKDHTAALQSTIARLEARVAELESGRGEPVAWANGEQLKLCAASPREAQPNNPMAHNLPRNIAGSALKTGYCNTPLYAAPPAPVAAPTDLLQRLAYALGQVGKADHLVDYDAVILAREDLRACLDATAALNK